MTAGPSFTNHTEVSPAGQVLPTWLAAVPGLTAPPPIQFFAPQDFLARMGIGCASWQAMPYGQKLALVSTVTPNAPQSTMDASVRNIDAYCQTQTRLSAGYRSPIRFPGFFSPAGLASDVATDNTGAQAPASTGSTDNTGAQAHASTGSMLTSLLVSGLIIGGIAYFGAREGAKSASGRKRG